MKRSQINKTIREFENLLKQYHFALPGFLSWTPEMWASKGKECDEIRDNMLGWDVTDYGLGDYDKIGLALITLRNGNIHNPKYRKPYAEKIMMLYPGQLSPNHYHWSKMEDIINRGGGRLGFHLWNSNPDGDAPVSEQLLDTEVHVMRDGEELVIPAGGEVILQPGESLTLHQGLYHEFYVYDAPTLIGEVSMCNDDNTDNRFLDMPARFPHIEEDEAPYRLLCSEYPQC